MKQITSINHVGIRVRDLKTSRAFYEQLGFEFIIGPIGPKPVAIMEHPSGVNRNFILNASDDASEKIFSWMRVNDTQAIRIWHWK